MADVFSLDKLSIRSSRPSPGGTMSACGAASRSRTSSKLCGRGVKEHSGPPPATSSSNEATPRHAQQYNATVPGQAYVCLFFADAVARGAVEGGGPQALSISQLKRVARERRIDTSHCFEKADLIAALRPPPLPPPAASLLPCVRVLPRVRPAPPTGAPPKTTPRAAPPPRRENGKPITPPQRPSFSSGYDEVWDVRREGDKLTPRINTLTRRDSGRERDPYASPYRRDPYRRDRYREQPNRARSDRSESSSSSLRRPAAARLRRAAAAARPPYRDRDPYRRPDPSPRDPYARDRDPYARDRDPHARDRDPYARDRDPYAETATRAAAATATRTRGRRRGTAITRAPPSSSRDRDPYARPPSSSRDRDPYARPTSSSRDRDPYARPTSSSRDRDPYARPASRDRDPYRRDRPRMRSPPREYEGELDPRSARSGWRPVRDEERRGELSPMEKAEGLGPVAVAVRQRFSHVRTEGLVARRARLGAFSQARTEGVVADATAAVARFLR